MELVGMLPGAAYPAAQQRWLVGQTGAGSPVAQYNVYIAVDLPTFQFAVGFVTVFGVSAEKLTEGVRGPYFHLGHPERPERQRDLLPPTRQNEMEAYTLQREYYY